jgi:hypothetical protein
MFRLFIISLLVSILSSQTITIYTDNQVNRVAQFEKEIVTHLFNLRDKKNKSKTDLKFVELKSFSEAFSYMDKNQYSDLKHTSFAINKISYTTERNVKYDFSTPYMLNYYSVMTLQESTKLHGLKDFNKNYTYGAVSATIFADKLMDLAGSKGIRHKLYSSVSQANMALQTGEVDIIVTDYVDSWEFGLKSLFFYEKTTDRLCILLPKGSKLKSELDQLIKYYIKSQQFYKLVKDYFGTDAVRFFKSSTK